MIEKGASPDESESNGKICERASFVVPLYIVNFAPAMLFLESTLD